MHKFLENSNKNKTDKKKNFAVLEQNRTSYLQMPIHINN